MGTCSERAKCCSFITEWEQRRTNAGLGSSPSKSNHDVHVDRVVSRKFSDGASDLNRIESAATNTTAAIEQCDHENPKERRSPQFKSTHDFGGLFLEWRGCPGELASDCIQWFRSSRWNIERNAHQSEFECAGEPVVSALSARYDKGDSMYHREQRH